MSYETIETEGVPIKAWTRGVQVEDEARRQLVNVARLPFVFRHVAAMPDVHLGIGATVGSVIPTVGAVIPAAVGVDIGCGMCAVRTSVRAEHLPDSLRDIRLAIEDAVPVGFAMHKETPMGVSKTWRKRFAEDYKAMIARFPKIEQKDATAAPRQLGTLGGGNHFIELCLDEAGHLWVMLHSGSRGIGNRIGTFFIERAKQIAAEREIALADRNLAWLEDGSADFREYVRWLGWAQDYARANRDAMLNAVVAALRRRFPDLALAAEAVNCHHNYASLEEHFGHRVWVTRKGAVRAGAGELGIVPGSMGAKSFIVRGKGNAESFMTCSHGAGRRLSRTAAKKAFTLDDHAAATAHVECRKDGGVLDETPGAYKDIDAVMAAQSDLVEVVHTLRQVVCVKG
ncbi:MAG: RtcB family protein [Candidatus Odyssella sp.]|nr:RtcB family protein [Candidatus Odyssella sp.]